MADALCGPSNALQNFQKHTSVDRTVQQDRLINRQSPAQGFRSAPGPNAGILDPEFDAFQAGHAGPPQPLPHHLPQFAQPQPSPHFTQPGQQAAWAADFQRLHISSPPTSSPQAFRPQASPAHASWHQDFLRQQSPAVAPQAYPNSSQSMFGGMSGYGNGAYAGSMFNQSQFMPAMQNQDMSVAQGKQRAEEGKPEFDDAAFERAFEQAHAEILGQELGASQSVSEARNENVLPTETDPILSRIREKRLPVYLSIKLRSATELGQTSEALIYLTELERLEQRGTLLEDASEARWCTDTLRKMINAGPTSEVQARAETLITAINERLMSTYPLGTPPISPQLSIWDDLEAAGYTSRTPRPESVGAQPKEEQKPAEKGRNDDDDMAQTAGRLLESVADNTSEKFQKSQFLELMRRLRDREVRVEGDKMVETNSRTTTFTPDTIDEGHIPMHEQDLDLGRSGVPGLDPTSSMPGHNIDANHNDPPRSLDGLRHRNKGASKRFRERREQKRVAEEYVRLEKIQRAKEAEATG